MKKKHIFLSKIQIHFVFSPYEQRKNDFAYYISQGFLFPIQTHFENFETLKK